MLCSCPNCRKEIDANARFCRFCGQKIEKILLNDSLEENTRKTCPQCGKKVKIQTKFCQYCGYHFIPEKTEEDKKDDLAGKQTEKSFEDIIEPDEKKAEELFEESIESDEKGTEELFGETIELDEKGTEELFGETIELDEKEVEELFEESIEPDEKETEELFGETIELDEIELEKIWDEKSEVFDLENAEQSEVFDLENAEQSEVFDLENAEQSEVFDLENTEPSDIFDSENAETTKQIEIAADQEIRDTILHAEDSAEKKDIKLDEPVFEDDRSFLYDGIRTEAEKVPVWGMPEYDQETVSGFKEKFQKNEEESFKPYYKKMDSPFLKEKIQSAPPSVFSGELGKMCLERVIKTPENKENASGSKSEDTLEKEQLKPENAGRKVIDSARSDALNQKINSDNSGYIILAVLGGIFVFALILVLFMQVILPTIAMEENAAAYASRMDMTEYEICLSQPEINISSISQKSQNRAGEDAC